MLYDNTYTGLVEKMKLRVHTVKLFEKTVPAIALPGISHDRGAKGVEDFRLAGMITR
jgi:hypothetical protein